jgi:polyhydroxyalkanoate synthase
VRTTRTDEPKLAADEWFETTAPLPGSWWPTWAEWLKAHSSKERVAPPAMGAPQAGYAPIGEAPGEYVRQK